MTAGAAAAGHAARHDHYRLVWDRVWNNARQSAHARQARSIDRLRPRVCARMQDENDRVGTLCLAPRPHGKLSPLSADSRQGRAVVEQPRASTTRSDV
eukprot:361126-Chlamydomonas_euryale.AAC.2